MQEKKAKVLILQGKQELSKSNEKMKKQLQMR